MMATIKQQERDLEWTESDFPLIKQCEDQLEPYRKLWLLAVEVTDNVKNWGDSNINTLDPAQVE